MNTHTALPQEGTVRITGPHAGRDRYGRLDHHYWRCERCGLESTDRSLRRGCWRCGDESEREAADGE